jgi:hypothetical protein
MQLSSYTLKAMLRKAWGECSATNPAGKLRDALLSYSSQVVGLVSVAGVVRSTSANGQHTVFDTGGGKSGADGNPTVEQIAQGWTYLVDEYDRAATELGALKDGTADDEIEAQMEANLRPVHPGKTNWMYLMK